MAIKRFYIAGMHCANCVLNARKQLESLPQVTRAEVNISDGSAEIEYTGALASSTIREALASIGFEFVEDEEETPEDDKLAQIEAATYKKLRFQTTGAILFSLPVFVYGMFFMHAYGANWIMLLLTTVVMVGFGRGFFISAFRLLRQGQTNMDTLVALSTGIAYLFSLFNTIYPQYWIDRGLEPHVYYEASSVIVALILLGRLLEGRARNHTSQAIRKLMELQPKEVIRLGENDRESVIPIRMVRKGDRLLIKPGDKIPVDGRLESGSSFVNESTITGESFPAEKTRGSLVYAGTLNQKGSFIFRAEQVGTDTVLAQIIKTVQKAQNSKAPAQRLADKISALFVPIVIAIALLTFIVWMVIGGEEAFSHALLTSVTVLVISCPCALGLATPTAIMVGIGKGAQHHILVKDATSLELMRQVKTVVLDKTGTITVGEPAVTALEWFGQQAKKQAEKSALMAIERRSEHPLAEAVIRHLKEPDAAVLYPEKFESLPGEGVYGVVNGVDYWVGNRALLQKNSLKLPPAVSALVSRWEKEGNTVVFFFSRDEILAAVAMADQIKKYSQQAVESLRRKKITVWMLTGDQSDTAAAVARKVGITRVKAGVLPGEKAQFIRSLQKDSLVAMVGDGVNDSQALVQADVSIAMGRGADVAMDVADITLITSDLNVLSKVFLLSRQVGAAIRQNLFWAFIYNIIGIPLAAGVLYPVNGFLLNPMIAAAAMTLSSISVVTNSLRIRWKPLK